MAQTKECAQSKNGWPLGKYEHSFGFTYAMYAPTLATLLKAKYSVDVTFHPYNHDERMGDLKAFCRVSMENFSIIRAFIQGFNANQ